MPTGHRPRSRPEALIADKAYSHPSTRKALRGRRISTVIPERDDQVARCSTRSRAGGRPTAFDAEVYEPRDVVERGFGRLKQWRGIATRYDKKARSHRSGVVLGAIILCWVT